MSGCYGLFDLEESEDPLDSIAFAIEVFVLANRDFAVRVGRDESLVAAVRSLTKIVPDPH